MATVNRRSLAIPENRRREASFMAESAYTENPQKMNRWKP
jgi:hypothetical protein